MVTDAYSATDAPPAPSYLQWSPVIAGALLAAALAAVLHAFASAIGLAVSSTAPTWRDGSLALWLLSGVYLLIVAAATFGLGGYVAGRMRLRLTNAVPDEVEFRDGVHGLVVWALASLLTVLLVVAGSQIAARLSATGGEGVGRASSAGERMFAYELDRLFSNEGAAQVGDDARAEAGRILMSTGSHDGIVISDRTRLVALVVARTGVPRPEVERRVQDAIVTADDGLRRARNGATLLAFFAGAAALVGAAAAWFGACAGGTHRDEARIPSLRRGVRPVAPGA